MPGEEKMERQNRLERNRTMRIVMWFGLKLFAVGVFFAPVVIEAARLDTVSAWAFAGGLAVFLGVCIIATHEWNPERTARERMIGMKFFRQLFRSLEVKAVLAELRLIESKLENESNPLGGYQFVKSTIWEAVADNPKEVTEQIRSGSQLPRELALNLLLNALEQEIRSGRNHIYRGILSMVGTSMRATFYWVLKQLEAEGFFSSDDVKHALDRLNEEVRDAG